MEPNFNNTNSGTAKAPSTSPAAQMSVGLPKTYRGGADSAVLDDILIFFGASFPIMLSGLIAGMFSVVAGGTILVLGTVMTFIYLLMRFRKKITVSQSGITVQFALHKEVVPWAEVKSIEWQGSLLMDQAVVVLLSGKKVSIQQAFKASWVLGRLGAIGTTAQIGSNGLLWRAVNPSDPRNIAVMSELTYLWRSRSSIVNSSPSTDYQQIVSTVTAAAQQRLPENISTELKADKHSKIVWFGGFFFAIFWSVIIGTKLGGKILVVFYLLLATSTLFYKLRSHRIISVVVLVIGLLLVLDVGFLHLASHLK